jgi:hypothetical protein
MIFARSQFSEIRITLRSNEVLGELDQSYIEDYFGTGGQVSLCHLATDTKYPVLMGEVTDSTPNVPHDVFRGFASLENLPDGAYEIQGRVRDLTGNYTILGEVSNPIGTERIVHLRFSVVPGEAIVEIFAPLLNIVPMLDVALPMDGFYIDFGTNIYTINLPMDKNIAADAALPKPKEVPKTVEVKVGSFIE